MPYLTLANHKLYFDDSGPRDGPVIITTHGVSENGSYWGRTGVTEALTSWGFRVIDTDMRGHGRSVPLGSGDPGYTVEEVAADFGRIANHLGVLKFHLLTHATGGMAAIEYAIHNSNRLLSLMSTDSGSATYPLDKYSDERFEFHAFERREPPVDSPMADARAAHRIEDILENARAQGGGPFLNRLDANAEPDRCWREVYDIMETTPLGHVADFMRSFYTSPDPKITGLRRIDCPVLLLLGEYDQMFVKPNELMARVIPNATHVVLPGIGHMTAIEDRAGTLESIFEFLKAHGLMPERRPAPESALEMGLDSLSGD